MEKDNRNKLIGLGMVLPLPIYSVYLIASTKIWAVVVALLVFAILFYYGLEMLKGASLEDIRENAIGKLEDLKEDVEEAVSKKTKKKSSTKKTTAKKSTKK